MSDECGNRGGYACFVAPIGTGSPTRDPVTADRAVCVEESNPVRGKMWRPDAIRLSCKTYATGAAGQHYQDSVRHSCGTYPWVPDTGSLRINFRAVHSG